MLGRECITFPMLLGFTSYRGVEGQGPLFMVLGLWERPRYYTEFMVLPSPVVATTRTLQFHELPAIHSYIQQVGVHAAIGDQLVSMLHVQCSRAHSVHSCCVCRQLSSLCNQDLEQKCLVEKRPACLITHPFPAHLSSRP